MPETRKKTTKELAAKLGLLRKRVSSSESQCLKRIKRSKQDFAYLIVIDFESTCWENVKNKAQEIIEFPAVLLNTSTGKIDSEFHYYIQPQEHPMLSDFCKELTGITQDQVDQGLPLSFAIKRFVTWLRRHTEMHNISYDVFSNHDTKCAFVTWSDWDLGVCLQYETKRKQIRKPIELNSWIDLRATYRNFYQRRPQGLNGALQDLGITFEGREHSGVCDARNTAQLAWRMMTDGCVLRITKTLNAPVTGCIGPKAVLPAAVVAPTKSSSTEAEPETGITTTKHVTPAVDPPQSTHPPAASVTQQQAVFRPPQLINITSKTAIRPVEPTERNSNHKQCSESQVFIDPDAVCGEFTGIINKEMEDLADCSFTDHCLVEPSISKASPVIHTPTIDETATSRPKVQPALPNLTNLQKTPQIQHNSVCAAAKRSNKLPSVPLMVTTPDHPLSKEHKTCEERPTGYVRDPTSSIKPQATTTIYRTTPVSRNPYTAILGKHTKPLQGPGFTIYQDSAVCSKTRESLQAAVTKPTNGKFKTPSPVGHGSKVSGLFKTPSPPAADLDSTLISSSYPERVALCDTTNYDVTPDTTYNMNSMKSNVCHGNSSNMKRTPPMCSCGRRSTRKLVQTPGPNQGRAFYCCPHGRGNKPGSFKALAGTKKPGCGFFKWENALKDSANQSTMSNISSFFNKTTSTSHIGQSFLNSTSLGGCKSKSGGNIVRRTQSFVIPPLPQPNFNTPQSADRTGKNTKDTGKTMGAGHVAVGQLRY